MNSEPDYLGFLIIGLALFIFAYRVLKFGSLTASMFGAKILKTIGEISASAEKANLSLKIHHLDSRESNSLVGLEIKTKTLMSYKITPVALNRYEAKKLVELIEGVIE